MCGHGAWLMWTDGQTGVSREASGERRTAAGRNRGLGRLTRMDGRRVQAIPPQSGVTACKLTYLRHPGRRYVQHGGPEALHCAGL